jgi:hypothetical protein
MRAIGEIVRVDLIVNLFAVDGHRLGSADSDSHLFATNLQHDDFYLVADDNALSELPGKYQHSVRHPWSIPMKTREIALSVAFAAKRIRSFGFVT